MKTRLSAAQLARMNPWEIAKHYGIGYSGDTSPIRHGGLFYDYSNWVRWGYASIVEFWEDPMLDAVMGDRVVISRGTINRPDDMSGAFACCGVEDADNKNNVFCQIECVRAYSGAEWDDGSMSFDLENEEYVWEEVRPWLEELQ